MVDAETINEILKSLGRLEAQMTEVRGHAEESDRALRGYDGEPGVVARLDSVQKKVDSMSTDIKADHEKLKEVAKYQADFPTLQWMAKYQTARFVSYIAGVLVLGLAAPLVGVNLLRVILHALQVPDPLIEFYLGAK
jgi:hypothetical protein